MTNSHRSIHCDWPPLTRAKRGTLASLHYSPPSPRQQNAPSFSTIPSQALPAPTRALVPIVELAQKIQSFPAVASTFDWFAYEA